MSQMVSNEIEINPRKLVNSEKNRQWAKQFLNRIKEFVESNKNMVKIILGDIKRRPKEYVVLRENLECMYNYANYLIASSYAKPLSAARVVNLLIYFGSFIGEKPFKEVKREDIEKFFEEYGHKSETYKATFRRVIKPFFRWLYKYEKEEGYPEIVKWIYCGRKNDNYKLPEILTMEEIQKMIEVCDNFRDRALIAVLYESGCRASEILDLKISDLNFDEYGVTFLVNGKTGSRRVRLTTSSATELKAWLNVHPRKNEVNAPLFCALTKNNKGNPLGDSSLDFIIKQIAEKAGITKKVHPHLFRHTRATHLAKCMTEQELKVFFGWTQDSKMASVYVHLSGKDVEEKILQISGIKLDKVEEKAPVIPTVKCYRCGEINSIGNEFCWKCGAPLTQKEIEKIEILKEFLIRTLPDLLELLRGGEIKIEDLEYLAKLIKKTKEEKDKDNKNT